MLDLIDAELRSLITNVFKPPKILTSHKLSSSLGLLRSKRFHGFANTSGRTEPIACVVFHLFIKIWENYCQKPYQNWQTAVKTFKKHQIVPTGAHKKGQILFRRFLGEYVI